MSVHELAPVAELGHRRLRSEDLDRRATRVLAHARLRTELRSIVLDVLGLYEPIELPAEVAAWVGHATEIAVSAVCDTTVVALLDSVEATIDAAPPSVVARLEQAAMRSGAGID